MDIIKTANGVVLNSNGNVVANGSTLEFDDLANKPKYNNVEMSSETNIPLVNSSKWDGYESTINTHSINIANLQNVTPLISTGDTTDRTTEIQTVLNTNGVCRLGTGVFYTTGIIVPTNCSLCGSGEGTILILDSSVTDGYAIALTSDSSVTDITIRGTSNGDLDISSGVIGSRNGIVFDGGVGTYQRRSTIHHCIISGFNGGGIKCNDTSMNIHFCLNVTDCHIYNCIIGIYIRYISEYHRFSNISITWCYYGCINNGGNNIFIGCSFSKNIVGLLMENDENNISPNAAHGSFVGCVFNHSGNNNDGIAIKAIYMEHGEIFSGCQLFYGEICLENSRGFTFSGCEIGNGVTLNIKNTPVMFSGCSCGSGFANPTITEGSRVRFVDCYYINPNGEEVKNNRVNILDSVGTKNDILTPSSGITLKWNKIRWEGTIDGVQDGSLFICNIWRNANSISPLVTGRKYRLDFESPYIGFVSEVYFDVGEELICVINTSKSNTFTVPDNATGVLLRVCTAGWPVTYVNDKFTIALYE